MKGRGVHTTSSALVASEHGFGKTSLVLVVITLTEATFLLANDFAEFIWGWPDYEFAVDQSPESGLFINLDMLVNMPCQCARVRALRRGPMADAS